MWNRFTLVLITVLSINACSTINCLASGSSPERVLSKQVNGMIGSNFCRSEKYQTSFYEYIFNDLKLFDGNNLFKNNDIYIVEKIVGSTTLIYVLIGDNIAKYKNERKYSNRRHLLWSKPDCKLIYFNKILGFNKSENISSSVPYDVFKEDNYQKRANHIFEKAQRREMDDLLSNQDTDMTDSYNIKYSLTILRKEENGWTVDYAHQLGIPRTY